MKVHLCLAQKEAIFFNILLDDRAGLEGAFNILKYVVKYANSQSDSSTKK